MAATLTVTAPAAPDATPMLSSPSPTTCSAMITAKAAPTRNRNEREARPWVVSSERQPVGPVDGADCTVVAALLMRAAGRSRCP